MDIFLGSNKLLSTFDTSKKYNLNMPIIAFFVIVFFLLISLAAPLLPLHDPYEINLDAVSEQPTFKNIFGTDSKGRDIFSRVVYGAKFSISIAFTSAFVSCFIGFCIGLISGYVGGRVDSILMSFADFVMSFPSILLASAISIVLPAGIFATLIALSAVNWTSFARLIRGQVLTFKNMPFVEAAKAIGCSDFRIILMHIAPVCIQLALVMVGIKLGGFIVAEATLSFLGLGAQPPLPTWGAMISAHMAYILSAPWMVIFPGLAISITAYCCNVIGEGLKKRFDLKDS